LKDVRTQIKIRTGLEYARVTDIKASMITVVNALYGGDSPSNNPTETIVAETVEDVQSFFNMVKGKSK
jgi:hypothetical protein